MGSASLPVKRGEQDEIVGDRCIRGTARHTGGGTRYRVHAASRLRLVMARQRAQCLPRHAGLIRRHPEQGHCASVVPAPGVQGVRNEKRHACRGDLRIGLQVRQNSCARELISRVRREARMA